VNPDFLTLAAALRFAIDTLYRHGNEQAGLEAEVLLAHVLAQPRVYLKARPESVLAPEQWRRLQDLVRRRAEGEPVAYLTGAREFWSLELEVTPATLIPRPETERLVELALERVPNAARWHIADLGTGSGAIALALARERPTCHVIAVDCSPDALSVARRNAQRLDIANVEFRLGSWLEPLRAERLDLIVANPPYVAAADPHLLRGDLRHEPRLALSAGEDALRDLRSIITTASDVLRNDGWLLVEHGYDQQSAVCELFARAGYTNVSTYADYAGVPRVVAGQWRPC
jgi:release factor glutamine methyltransferase